MIPICHLLQLSQSVISAGYLNTWLQQGIDFIKYRNLWWGCLVEGAEFERNGLHNIHMHFPLHVPMLNILYNCFERYVDVCILFF